MIRVTKSAGGNSVALRALLASAFLFAGAAAAGADERGRLDFGVEDEPDAGPDQNDDLTVRVRRAASVYEKFSSSPAPLPKEIASRTKCIAIFPDVTKAAFIVGSSRGDGVASCKTKEGLWSYVAFMDLVSASVGMQAGLKRSDWIVFFVSDKAVSALRRGSVSFGTDVTGIAGTFGEDFKFKPDATPGVVAYSESDGAFAGLALDGTIVKGDPGAQEAYYGKDVDYTALLDKTAGQGTSQAMADLLGILPKG